MARAYTVEAVRRRFDQFDIKRELRSAASGGPRQLSCRATAFADHERWAVLLERVLLGPPFRLATFAVGNCLENTERWTRDDIFH